MSCEQCRAQLLPFLYELLDAPERTAMTAHLESCAECQEALKSAREQQGMLAEAVKEQHPDIVFKAPAKVSPASTAPTVLMQRPPGRRLWLNRWAAAAALLFVLVSAGVVVGFSLWRDQADDLESSKNRLARAKTDLSKTQDELNQRKGQTQKEIRAIQQQIDTLFDKWRTEEVKTRKVLEDKGAQLIINGPQNPLAGAPNRYDVAMNFGQNQKQTNLNKDAGTKDKGNKAEKDKTAEEKKADVELLKNLPGGMMNVRAINQKTGKTLYEQQVKMLANQNSSFVLPSNMPIAPNEDIALQFQAKGPDGKLVTLTDNLNLVFPEYVTHLATDRPMYRPGETVRFRSLTLERFSLKPAPQKFHLRYRIVGPKNEAIFNQEVASLAGLPGGGRWLRQIVPIKGPGGEELYCIGAGEFPLPAKLASGQYTLSVSEVNERFNEEKRTFLVHNGQPPRFNKEVQFHRNSYGAGDQLRMQVQVMPVQGAQLGKGKNLTIAVSVVVDGIEVLHNPSDRAIVAGKPESFECILPPEIAKGVGTVKVTCSDGGPPETLVRSIPLVVRELNVEFFPEGGELVAGVPNRVYFQARTPANRPADFEGRIVDERNQEVVRVKTVSDDTEPGINQGLGSFTFTPQMGKTYALRIDSPIAIARPIKLDLEVKKDGVVLNLPQGVAENEIDVRLHSMGKPRELLVGAYCRGRMVDYKLVKAGANQPTRVMLRPMAGVGGVYRITVFEKSGVDSDLVFHPLAERLIYRKSAERVDVAVSSDRASYQPGDSVRLTFKAKSEKNAFVPTLATIAVVDNSLLKLADEKTARGLQTHFLLTTEVRNPEDLEYADVLLSNHPKASVAIDLLLGSQGWRRFAEQDPVKFQLKQQQQVVAQGQQNIAQGQQGQQQKQPNFLANSVIVPQFVESEQKQLEKLDQPYVKKAIKLEAELGEKEKDEAGPAELRQAILAKHIAVAQIEENLAWEGQRLHSIRTMMIQFGLGGASLMLLFLGFFLLSVGLRRLSDGTSNARGWLGSGIALLGVLFLISVVGTFAFMGENMLDLERNGRMAKPVAVKQAPLEKDPLPNQNEPAALVDTVDVRLEEDLKERKAPVEVAKKLRDADVNPPAAPVGGGVELRFWNANAWLRNLEEQEERELRQQGNYQALVHKYLGRRVQLPPARDPSVVRIYAHQHLPNGDGVRDLAQTVYWHPVLVMPDGKGEVTFDLSDSVTRFQVLVLSHTFDGRLGTNRFEITSKLPFSMEPIVPAEVSDKDQIVIPVPLGNDLAKPTTATLSARVKGLQLAGDSDRTVQLGPNERKRANFQVNPTIHEGTATIRILGKTPDASASDAVERRFKIVPDGIPFVGSIGGVLEDRTVEHEITLPDAWIAGSLQVQAHFYPSPLAELQSGLDALLREPAGCFEQTASNNYPNALILQHLQRFKGASSPAVEKRARQLLQTGYQKLAAFECADPAGKSGKRGYEWFGAAPPHEALTAYGLLQFRDMASVYHVEPAMLQRNEQFLLDQRDQKGGFHHNPAGAPQSVTNAYIVWALTENGVKDDLDKELAALRDECKTNNDPYFLTLVALSHLNPKMETEGIELLKKVRESQKDDGRVSGAATSITGSQGRDLDVETTALAVLGWVKADRLWHARQFQKHSHLAVRWLNQQRQGAGSFGGTQATVLALQALIAYQQQHPRTLEGGSVNMTMRMIGRDGDKTVSREERTFLAPTQESITLSMSDIRMLTPGKNTIQLNVTGKNPLPYTLTWSYRTAKPANDPKTPVKLSTSLSQQEAKEGGTVKLTAVLENVSGKGQGMTVAVIGLPAGVSLPQDGAQLKALAVLKPGKIAAWELRGRELVLYWRDLAADARIEIELDLLCRLPGVYRGPASRAYLYYDGDRKFWTEPLDIRIDVSE